MTQELDDYFEILIDSRLDRRNAYVFQVNPLGTQRDALITDEQVGETQDGDPGWDGVWTSEARITRDGWTATIAIPFFTLNFMRSRDVVWGLNFKRFIRRKNEEDLWSGWQRTFGAAKISQAGELHGINEIGSGRLFVVEPYVLGRLQPPACQRNRQRPDSRYDCPAHRRCRHQGWLRSNLVANLTGNTDFADADVDTQQFNLTPYKLFFPEKRQFFLENAGVSKYPRLTIRQLRHYFGTAREHGGGMLCILDCHHEASKLLFHCAFLPDSIQHCRGCAGPCGRRA